MDTNSWRGLWRVAGSFLGRGTGWIKHGLCTVRYAVTNKKELVGKVIISGNHYFSAHKIVELKILRGVRRKSS